MLAFFSNLGTYVSEGFDLALIGGGCLLAAASYATSIASVAASPLAAAFGGPVGKIIRYAGVALILGGGCRLYVTRQIAAHDAMRAAIDAEAVANAEADAYKRGAASAAQQAQAQVAQEQATQSVKTVIIHDGPSKGCRDTPALHAAAAELRKRSGAGADQATAPR